MASDLLKPSYDTNHFTNDRNVLVYREGNEEDYYNPQNSNLIYVIKEKKGIPISMVSVYMLVGKRIGIMVEGCHFPGHFLARIDVKGKKAFVDCFSSGQMIHEEDMLKIREGVSEGIDGILREKASAKTIVRRFLANLIRVYQLQDKPEDTQLFVDLFKDLDRRLNDRMVAELTPEDIISVKHPDFKPGQLVRHKRYGYRGIVVDCDAECMATDDWYYGNQTQPERHQSWYHMLVAGSDHVTYVAESNIVLDESSKAIDHPLLSYFFIKSDDGQYIRNDNPWPDTEF